MHQNRDGSDRIFRVRTRFAAQCPWWWTGPGMTVISGAAPLTARHPFRLASLIVEMVGRMAGSRARQPVRAHRAEVGPRGSARRASPAGRLGYLWWALSR